MLILQSMSKSYIDGSFTVRLVDPATNESNDYRLTESPQIYEHPFEAVCLHQNYLIYVYLQTNSIHYFKRSNDGQTLLTGNTIQGLFDEIGQLGKTNSLTDKDLTPNYIAERTISIK